MQKINIVVQKIDGFSLKTYNIVIAAFQVLNMFGRSQFFWKTFLLANINIEVVLSIFFLTFNNVDIQFAEKKLIWRTYITKKALPATRLVKFIDKKEFAITMLDKNIETFVIYISSLGSRITFYSARKA